MCNRSCEGAKMIERLAMWVLTVGITVAVVAFIRAFMTDCKKFKLDVERIVDGEERAKTKVEA